MHGYSRTIYILKGSHPYSNEIVLKTGYGKITFCLQRTKRSEGVLNIHV